MVISMCSSVPKYVAYAGGELVKSIIPNVNYKHSSVRILALQALAAALIVEASALEEAAEAIYPLILDRSHSVREKLYDISWELLSKLIDRHIYGYKFLPILYAGSVDEMPKLSQKALQLLDKIGEQYEQENTGKIKDELDYTDGRDYPGRPRIGSRHYANDNIQKILKKQVELLGDWNLDMRFKSAEILTAYTPYVENNITAYIGTVFPTVYKVLAGDESHIMERVIFINKTVQFTQQIGKFVSLDSCLALILPALKGGVEGVSVFRLGCLRTLQGLLSGSSADEINVRLEDLINSLGEAELVNNENSFVILEIAKCLRHIGEKLNETNIRHFGYYYLLLKLASIPGSDKIAGFSAMNLEVQQCLSTLAHRLGFSNQSELHGLFLDETISTLNESHREWNEFSTEPVILCNALSGIGSPFVYKLSSLLPILSDAAESHRPFEVRKTYFLLT
jgi:dynein assembly factor 5